MSQLNLTPPLNSKKIDYVVAHKWDESKPICGNLAIYAYRTEIQHGTLEDAKRFLDYVRERSPEDDWSIYKVSFSKLTVID